MKLIAHRGASLLFPENSLESLTQGAKIGADAVECDVHRTADQVYVIFHDPDLRRLAGDPRQVSACDADTMRTLLAAKGQRLWTLDELLAEYREDAPLLLHLKVDAPQDALIHRIDASPVPLIIGVSNLAWLEALAGRVQPARLLAFLPDPGQRGDFARAGAGIIRLWEHWLPGLTPRMIHDEFGLEAFIMCRDAKGSMNGSLEALDRFAALGADGVLLNDIALGSAWRTGRQAPCGVSAPPAQTTRP